jgi:hypothetical protein
MRFCAQMLAKTGFRQAQPPARQCPDAFCLARDFLYSVFLQTLDTAVDRWAV